MVFLLERLGQILPLERNFQLVPQQFRVSKTLRQQLHSMQLNCNGMNVCQNVLRVQAKLSSRIELSLARYMPT